MNSFNQRIYCVYVFKNIEGIIKYVGNGTKYRSKDLTNRSSKVKEYIKHNAIQIEILKDELTKSEAESIEEAYLLKYLNNPKDGWELLNQKSISKVRVLTYDMCNTYFYYDENSPSFLKWKVERTNGRNHILMEKDSNAGHKDTNNYYVVQVNGLLYRANRIIAVLKTKSDLSQDLVVNHIDSNPSNNSINNLEVVSWSENSFKSVRSKKTNTGLNRIFWRERDKSYVAAVTISFNRKTITKYFNPKKYNDCKEAALLAAIEWRDLTEKQRSYDGET